MLNLVLSRACYTISILQMRKQGLGEGLAQRPTAGGGRARAGGPPVTVRGPRCPVPEGSARPSPVRLSQPQRCLSSRQLGLRQHAGPPRAKCFIMLGRGVAGGDGNVPRHGTVGSRRTVQGEARPSSGSGARGQAGSVPRPCRRRVGLGRHLHLRTPSWFVTCGHSPGPVVACAGEEAPGRPQRV